VLLHKNSKYNPKLLSISIDLRPVGLAIFGQMRTALTFLSIFLLFALQTTYAQNGLPFMTDIELNRQYSDSRITSIVQDGEESMYFATSRGLLKFDGFHWSRIGTPAPATKVFYHSVSNRLFVGLKDGAVELVRSDSGVFEVIPIPGISNQRPIVEVIGTDKEVFFIGENEIHQLNPLSKDSVKTHKLTEHLISGAFFHQGKLHLLLFQEGLFAWNDGELGSIGSYIDISEDQLLFSIESTAGTYLGFESDALYLFKDGKLNRAKSQLQKFLQENLVSHGILLNDSLMAYSTLAGGAIVANVNTQEISYKFDYSTGTKDNEIFCLGTDRDRGLWLAYESGLTRIDLLQPVRSFISYPGLEGNLTSSIMANGQLHVGTGNGVYVLQKASSKAEIQRMIDEMIRKKRAAKRDQVASYVPPKREVKSQESESTTLLERFKEDPQEVKKELTKQEIRELKKELRKQRREARKGKTVGEAFEDFFKGGRQRFCGG
jgi:ligand-binding sensor domain-containing protein